MSSKFFNMSEASQKVNQWLCVIFFGVLVFWSVVYYLSDKAVALSSSYLENEALVSER